MFHSQRIDSFRRPIVSFRLHTTKTAVKSKQHWQFLAYLAGHFRFRMFL